MFNSLSLRRLLVIASMVAVPLSSSAALASDLITTPDDIPVMRAEFLRASIIGFGISAKGVPTGSYTRPVAKNMQPYVAAAEKLSALSMFGKDLSLSRNITRGEAVQMAVKLQKRSAVGLPLTFGDVPKDSELATAVQVAIENKWIKPISSSMFGATRVLTGREARVFLQNIIGETNSIENGGDNTTKANSTTITIKGKDIVQIPENEILRAVWQLLNQQYLYKEKIDPKKAGYDAAQALVNSLKDPYTTFLPPADARQFEDQIQGEVSGIGAQVEYRDNVLLIIAPLSGSPAEKAGLKAGDEILSVDGVSLAGLQFTEAVRKVRGEKGSKALLRIRRDGRESDVTVTRDVIRVPEIDISFQGDIAIVKLVQFGQTTDRELRSLMQDVQKQDPTGLILDLRNNPGGLLHAAETVVSNFLPKGSGVAIIKSRDNDVTDVTVDGPTIDSDVPVIVLVNKGSASASEIVAGALQDAGRAKVVGQKTFGKGTVQQVIDFRDGSSMKMTIAEWLTPKGRKINGIGLMPDIDVAASDVRDEQLLHAIDLLR